MSALPDRQVRLSAELEVSAVGLVVADVTGCRHAAVFGELHGLMLKEHWRLIAAPLDAAGGRLGRRQKIFGGASGCGATFGVRRGRQEGGPAPRASEERDSGPSDAFRRGGLGGPFPPTRTEPAHRARSSVDTPGGVWYKYASLEFPWFGLVVQPG